MPTYPIYEHRYVGVIRPFGPKAQAKGMLVSCSVQAHADLAGFARRYGWREACPFDFYAPNAATARARILALYRPDDPRPLRGLANVAASQCEKALVRPAVGESLVAPRGVD